MIEFENTAVVITANLSGAALPGLPMVDVAGQPLVARAAANVEKAGLGMVIVATPPRDGGRSARVPNRHGPWGRPRATTNDLGSALCACDRKCFGIVAAGEDGGEPLAQVRQAGQNHCEISEAMAA